MEEFLKSQQGTSALLASIAVALCLNLLLTLGKFVFELMRKKSEASDSKVQQISDALNLNTSANNELRLKLEILQVSIGDINRLKVDIQKLFSVVKIIAGKRWPEVRKAMEEDIFPK